MGIRQISLVILVFVLLASTASAVSFEWAMGNSGTQEHWEESFSDQQNACFVENTPINALLNPVIVVDETMGQETLTDALEFVDAIETFLIGTVFSEL